MKKLILLLLVTFGLSLPGHGVFKVLRNVDIPDLYGLNCDAPRIRLLIQNTLQFVAHRVPLRDHLRQLVPPDGFP